jgi:hypothetical protein
MTKFEKNMSEIFEIETVEETQSTAIVVKEEKPVDKKVSQDDFKNLYN